jgi:hypothetical protein
MMPGHAKIIEASPALTAGLQKVSGQLELGESAAQTVWLPAIALREGGNDHQHAGSEALEDRP